MSKDAVASQARTEPPPVCCEPTQDCCGGLDRRAFLKSAGAGLVSLSSPAALGGWMAGPFSAEDVRISHFVPADKRLNAAWVKSLYAKGEPRAWRDGELSVVGMPVGGIAAGQLYLCGDGTLGCWQIFNQNYHSGYGANNFAARMPARPVEQGFAIAVRTDDGVVVRRLDRMGFPGVAFRGEHPIATVTYEDESLPVRVELEAFSPFVPLNAKDSALPATVLSLTIESRSEKPVEVVLGGWLANAVLHHSAPQYRIDGSRRNRLVSSESRRLALFSAAPPPAGERPSRPDVVLADFEGDGYAPWTAEGEALGAAPATGTLPGQNRVSGFEGAGLVNTYRGGDDATGRLVSPEFTIERSYLKFLIGGGAHRGETCVNLLVDGKAVRTATGQNSERLAWQCWDLRDLAGKLARIEVVDQRKGPWGHINVDQVTLTDAPRYGAAESVEQLEDFGTLALAMGGTTQGGTNLRGVQESPGTPSLESALREVIQRELGAGVTSAPDESYALPESRATLLCTAPLTIGAHEKRVIPFVVAWHFPNRENGQMYANAFKDAADVAAYVLTNLERLRTQTRLWRDTWYDSTLPRWLLDRLHMPVANLATGTCQWWKSGRFWAWEGVGCCHGTCTHVWNYAHALARLFPELERSVREMQDLGAALHEDGLIGFRGEKNKAYAADGQCGTILKCYREHQCSPDGSFLKRNWPKIRLAIEFLLRQEGGERGLIVNSQHNTYDINFEGPNTFVGALFLAALRAGEEMARELGEQEFADRLRRCFESGSRATVSELWNGEYFVQKVDLKQHPRDQYGDGCLSDQLFGQGWAHQLGLGYLYPVENVRTALRSVWKYNWAPDIGPQNAAHRPERWFVRPGQAGLFTCTWPKSEYLAQGVRYREEVWTGIEYQVAGHMIWEGMLDEALVMVRAVHDRYSPPEMNPYNEVECGDHYARALASWGVFTALCGFEYHGPRGHIGFAPRVSPANFRAAFTAAEGWGTFSQRFAEAGFAARIEVKHGSLRVRTVALRVPPHFDAGGLVIGSGQRSDRPAAARREDERVVITLEQDALIRAGESLVLRLGEPA